MLRFNSIISRILWSHVIVIGIASILIPFVLYVLLVSETNSLQRQSMREQADQIALHLSPHQTGEWALDLPEGMKDLFSEFYGRYAYAVLDRNGRVLFSSRSDQSAIFPADPRSPTPAFLETRRGNAHISGASFPKTISQYPLWIEVAENMSHRDALIDDVVANFFSAVAWITLPILLLVLGLDVEIVRRAFRPLLQASKQAAEIGPRRTDVRLPTEAIPDEIRPLVDAVNQALDRLEYGFSIQREFAADAAHELRTPLTILRTRIDTLADKQVSTALRRDVEAMSRTVGQLLEMAEIETVILDPSARADLREVCAEVVEFIAPLALAEGKDIALSGAEHSVWVNGDTDMIARAIRNLTENAIKHTPAGSSIEIAVDDAGVVHVRDEGPGIDESERKFLFQRFWRRDRTRSGNTGLGLSIVQRIVETHGGAVRVENRASGGAQFSVSFVRSSPPD